jgi:hypothetical protein
VLPLAVVDLGGELGWKLIRLLAAARSDTTSLAHIKSPQFDQRIELFVAV